MQAGKERMKEMRIKRKQFKISEGMKDFGGNYIRSEERISGEKHGLVKRKRGIK